MLKRLCACAGVLAATACGGGNSTPTTPTPMQANITVSASPNPAVSTVCSPACQGSDGRIFQWGVQGTLTIQETAGLGGSITSITDTSFNPQIAFTAADVVRMSGTNRVA